MGDDPPTGQKLAEKHSQRRPTSTAGSASEARANRSRTGGMEKQCLGGGHDLRLIAKKTSERHKYVPAGLKVVQHVVTNKQTSKR